MNCAGCGYDLQGLTDTRCPECGLPFDPQRPPLANVPWLRAGADAGWSSYWHTVAFVLLHPRQLSENVWRQVDVNGRHAARFRRITIFFASACACVDVLVASPSSQIRVLLSFAVVTGAAALLFFNLSTHWSDAVRARLDEHSREFRMDALYDFTAAPLALSPLATLSVILTSAGVAPGWSIVLTAGFILATWWSSIMMLQRFGARAGWGTLVVNGVLQIFFWGLTLFLSLAVLYVLIALASYLLY
jgi:hypothetical protein